MRWRCSAGCLWRTETRHETRMQPPERRQGVRRRLGIRQPRGHPRPLQVPRLWGDLEQERTTPLAHRPLGIFAACGERRPMMGRRRCYACRGSGGRTYRNQRAMGTPLRRGGPHMGPVLEMPRDGVGLRTGQHCACQKRRAMMLVWLFHRCHPESYLRPNRWHRRSLAALARKTRPRRPVRNGEQ